MEATAVRTRSGMLWALAGVLWAVAVLGIASIGLFLIPLAVVATVAAAALTGGRGAIGLVVAAVVVGAALLTFQAVTADPEVGGGTIAPPQ